MRELTVRRKYLGFVLCNRGLFICLLAAALSTTAWADVAGHPGDAVELSVSQNSPERIVLHYSFGRYRSATVSIDGEEFERLLLPGEAVSREKGAPALPRVSRGVIIPDDAEMKLTMLSERHYEVSAKVAPSKGRLPRSINPADVPYEFGTVYAMDAFYPGPVATLHEPYIMRDHRGIVVTVNPFQYNPVTGVLRVYTDLTIEVTAIGPGKANLLKRGGRGRSLSRAFHEIYASHFLNYNLDERYDPLDEEGELLIICYDAWLPNVQPLVDHKCSIGITTTAVGVSTIGNNPIAIKNYIQNAYDTSDLAFVLLVGDVDQVATPVAVSGYNGASDPTYSKLAGDDNYPDIIVGRFSSETAAHVDTQVERTIAYENMPANQQAWFWKGTGIASDGGPGDDDEMDAEHMDNIRDDLLEHGYTEVDRIYDPDASAADVTAALNAGRGIVNYIGHGGVQHWGTTGFNDSDVNALINDNTLPFIFSVACDNGAFDICTCFGEAWLRATHGGVPTGAIATYMSSISQPWNPPMEAQDEFNLLYLAEAYHSYGALCYAGSCSMMDDYPGDGDDWGTGPATFNTWHIFGDPSLCIAGLVRGMGVAPGSGLAAEGQPGGPFTPGSIVYTLENLNDTPLDYEVSKTQPWVSLANASGTLPPHGTALVTVSINSAADSLPQGQYGDTVSFVNLTDHDGDTTREVTLKVGVPTVQYQWTLDTDPGWTTQGEWAFGHPSGDGGYYGNPDPDNGATGTNVYGINLAGDYSTSPGGPYYLTLGPVDLTNVSEVSLKFQRWLNSDCRPYVAATIEVSNDGGTWNQIWLNGDTSIEDSAWSQLTYDVNDVAAGELTVYVRWSHEVTPGAWAYSGWNIDDVEIWGLPGAQPTPGDLDGDGDVDLADLAQLLSNYGMTSGAAYEDGDLDGDGDVDLADLAALLAVYGTTYP